MARGSIKKVEPTGWILQAQVGTSTWHAVGQTLASLCGKVRVETELSKKPDLDNPPSFVCAYCMQRIRGGWLEDR